MQAGKHAPVAVSERVYAREVQDEAGDEGQRIKDPLAHGMVVSGAQLFHRVRGGHCGRGAKPHASGPVSRPFHDGAITVFPASGKRMSRMAMEHRAQLEDDVGRDVDVIVALVNQGKRVPVSRNLLLVAVLGCAWFAAISSRRFSDAKIPSVRFDAPVLCILANPRSDSKTSGRASE